MGRFEPISLYKLSLKTAVKVPLTSNYFTCIPNNVLFDLYEGLFDNKRLCFLSKEFSNLTIFYRLIFNRARNYFLLKCYNSLLNHDKDITDKLLKSFLEYSDGNLNFIALGLRMGQFLNDGGWYGFSVRFLERTVELIGQEKEVDMGSLLECYRLKLHAESLYCDFKNATKTIESIQQILANPPNFNPNYAAIYCTFSTHAFVRSNFDESYNWAIKALELLTTKGLSSRTILDVLRQASKACVVKRKFMQARFLIEKAMTMGREINMTQKMTTYSDILMDYGFFLLNSDWVEESVHIYNEALEERRALFDEMNIHVALAHEDLAYAVYVNEYSTGSFGDAINHTEHSIRIMTNILPENHLLLASVRRVKALIIEEVALDQRSDEDLQESFLETAKQLHMSALKLSQEAFGEDNVQTAKHYGNLGRLYQSMREFEQAETMHKKAIAIKEKLLGPQDYEVGLSIGHLASLYNYHMKKYSEAIELYIRSIKINIRLFGPEYSGLEYDYRGLVNIYTALVEPEKVIFYNRVYREWKRMREEKMLEQPPGDAVVESVDEVKRRFFEIGEEQKEVEMKRHRLAESFTGPRARQMNVGECA